MILVEWSSTLFVSVCKLVCLCFCFFKQKTASEMRISDWSSDVCSSDLTAQSRHFECDHDDQRVLEHVVVERAECLGQKERQEAALRKQGKLVVGHPLHSVISRPAQCNGRSEEHTSELQSLMRISYAVFCLKKKNKTA